MRWIKRSIVVYLAVLFVLLLPFQAFAAKAEKLIPMGHSIGIHMNLKGVFVINDVLLDDEKWLKAGDVFKQIDSKPIKTMTDFDDVITNLPEDRKVILSVKRGNQTVDLESSKKDLQNFYPFVRDRTEGIGTLTYIDPEKGEYGALGHQIIDAALKSPPSFSTGSIYLATIEQIKKSVPGNPGYKISSILKEDHPLGDIQSNEIYGIFGDWQSSTLTGAFPEPLEIMREDEVKPGKATIYTTIEGETVEQFSIAITSVKGSSFQFELTDKELISKTGGILQGMSGSPIIQNGKFAGVITHMFVEDPLKGAALPMTKMLKKQP
ncbi:SpoIVB peptidase S55 domain-containing protein [Chungangia koreensis]|uniref:SpoIVB peptidase S55 domain-containing protein n=1 Tax=Chungangia koreensis TaxID=752657 RepID=A0ABV8X6W3_9LACT